MNINHIREFIVLAETLNFTKAANKLYCSQPALSKHIAAIEKELGTVLVERGEGHVALTPIGSIYLEDARRIVRDYDQSLATIQAAKKARPMHACIETYMPYKPIDDQLRIARRELRRRHPLLQLEVRAIGPTSPIDDVRNGLADVCLASVSPDADLGDLAYTRLYEEPLVVIARKGHPLAKKTSIDAEEIGNSIIHVPTSPSFSDVFSRFRQMLEDRGATPVFVEHDWDSIDRLYDFDFQTGLFVTNAGEILANAIVSEMDSYSIIPFNDEGMKIPCLAIYRSDNDNPARPIIVEALKDHFVRTDMSCYWKELFNTHDAS